MWVNIPYMDAMGKRSPEVLAVFLFLDLCFNLLADIFFQEKGILILDFFMTSSHLSHEKNPPTFHYTGWLIGILIMVY